MKVIYQNDDEMLAVDQPVLTAMLTHLAAGALVWAAMSGDFAFDGPLAVLEVPPEVAIVVAVLIVVAHWMLFPFQKMSFDAREGLLVWVSWRPFWRWQRVDNLETIHSVLWRPSRLARRSHAYWVQFNMDTMRVRIEDRDIGIHVLSRGNADEATCFVMNRWLDRARRRWLEIEYADELDAREV